jgi:hypothetical protein
MKFDDAEYFFLNFETGLDNSAANTHIGMFLAWCVLRGLAKQDANDEAWTQAVGRLKRREITGGELLSEMCDGKLLDDDLGPEGIAFANAYYEPGFGRDYASVLGDQMPSTGHDADDLCSVPDTWGNFDRLAPLLDKRHGDWKSGSGGSGGSPGKPSGGTSANPGGGATLAKPSTMLEPLELSLEPIEGETPGPVPAPMAAAAPASAEPREPLESLQKRAASGSGDAWYELGAEYITGERIPRDFAKAADAFEKAAQLGVAQAAFNLAVCYQNGDGRAQDPKQMLRWFALAAEGGHGPATYYLAMAYRQGRHLQQDFVASNALMLLARARGVKEAAEAGVMAGSMAESGALATRLQEPGQLVAVLSARRRALAAGKVSDGMDGWRDPAAAAGVSAGGSGGEPAGAAEAVSRNATRATTGGGAAPARRQSSAPRSAVSQQSPTEVARRGIGLGHVALLLGAVALVPLLVAASSLAGGKLKALATALSLVGAVGVFVVSGSMRTPLVMRLVLTALATIPFLGSFACMLVTWGWVRRRNEAP